MNTKTLYYALLGLALSCVLLVGGAHALTVSSDILEDTTWTLADSPVQVVSPVRVLEGATLTVEPGVLVRFESGASLRVGQLNAYGDNRDKGNLQAVGTADLPIVFTSSSGVRTWAGIEIDARRGIPDEAMTLAHVTIEKSTGAGLTVRSNPTLTLANALVRSNNGPGLQLEGSTVSITDSEMSGNAANGILGDSGTVLNVRNVTLALNDGHPVQAHPHSLLEDVTYRQNGQPAIVFTGGVIRRDLTWARVTDAASGDAIDYRVLGDVRVRDRATLTVEPGVVVKFDPGADLLVGDCCTDVRDQGAIVAVGTPSDPITFTSRTGLKDWGGIEIDGRATSIRLASRLSDVLVERAAGRGLTVRSHDNVELSGVRAEGNGGTGIELFGVAGSYTGLAAVANGGQGIYVRDGSPYLEGARADNNGQMGVYLSNSASLLRDLTASGNRYGVFSDSNANPQIDGATIENNRERPIRANFPGRWDGLLLRGNAIPQIETWGWTLNADKTLPAHADLATGAVHEYVFLQDTHVRNGATLTVAPGLTLRFNPGAGLYVGACCSSTTAATMIADGTAESPIVFRSTTGNRDWQGVRVDSRGLSLTSVIDHVSVLDSNQDGLQFYGPTGGRVSNLTVANTRNDGLYAYDTSVPFENVEVRDSGRFGIRLGGSGSPSFTDVTVLRSGSVGVYGDPPVTPAFERVTVSHSGNVPMRTAMGTELATVTFRNSTLAAIEYYGSPITRDYTVARTLEANSGVQHEVRVRGPDFRVYGNSTLTFSPGLTLRLGDTVYIHAGACCSMTSSDLGAIVARGEPGAPIVFTSISRLDRWGGFQLEGRSLEGELPSAFENVVLEQAVGNGIFADQYDDLVVRNVTFQFNGAGVRLAGSDVTVEDSRFQYNRGTGLVVSRQRESWYGESGYSSPTVTGNVFHENQGYGLWSEAGSRPTIRDNRFSNNTNAGLTVDVDAFSDDNTFTLNGGGILEISGGNLRHDLTMGRIIDVNTGTPIPYTVLGDVTVTNGATLTVAPGVTVRFAPNAGISVGACCEPTGRGSLVAEGEDGLPVTFRGRTANRDWDGITIAGNGPDAYSSSLRWVVIEKASGHGITVADNARVVLSDVTIRDSANGVSLIRASPTLQDVDVINVGGVGIRLEGASPHIVDSLVRQAGNYGVYGDAGSRPVFRATTIEQGAGRAARLGLGADLSGLTLSRNAIREVELHGGAVTRDATLPGLVDAATGAVVRYAVLGDVTVRDAATLTLEAGARLAWAKGESCSWWTCSPVYYGMRVGVGGGYREFGVLVANGTPERPVVFTTKAGDRAWNGLSVYGQSGKLLPTTTLRHVVIENSIGHGLVVSDHNDVVLDAVTARNNAANGASIVRTPALVTGSEFASNAGTGLAVHFAAATVRGSEFVENGGSGLYVEGAAPTVEDVAFVRNGASAVSVQATPDVTVSGAVLDGNAYDVGLLSTTSPLTVENASLLGLDGVEMRFTSTTGSGAWNRFGFRDLDPHHIRGNATGGQNGFLEVRIAPTFHNASYEYEVRALDGSLTQIDSIPTDSEAGLTFRMALNGFRRAALDVIPVVIPDFSYSPDLPTVVHDVQFVDETFVRFATVVNHTWDFGDGGGSFLEDPVHRYARRGDFIVVHCVVIGSDPTPRCTEGRRVSVVNHLPIADFTITPAKPMAMEEITFTDASTDPDGFVVRRGWEFGDNVANNLVPENNVVRMGGNVAFGSGNSEVKHRYQYPGRYLVNLTIEDNLLGRTVLQREIWVRTPVEKAVETILDTAADASEVADDARAEAEAVLAGVTGDAGAIVSALEDAAGGNLSAAREAFRGLVREMDVEAEGLLCIEAALGLEPATEPIALCAASVVTRNAAELDTIIREIEHEVAKTEIPPAFVPDPQELLENPPPPPPPPQPPQVPPEPPTLPDVPPEPPQLPPEPPTLPDVPGAPEPDVPDVPDLGVPELPRIPRICLDDVCVP